ncbi:ubiquinol-cytochrome c reductase iron-sulfur subunit [Saccharomonospora sp. NB11]|jgi:Rieske Fe-S protein|uniref:QcrA and Rieske domain-containing protein n=1 Tax=Saccharomonospora sp. NB11 TaxID=1642298 RepID=UPI0018D1528C|nr:Rieske (2Fe-2S) protein [Saccharomonospora sp. NB11]
MTGHAHSRRTVLTTGATVAGAALGTAALAACSGPGTDGTPPTSVPKGTRIARLDDLSVGSSKAVTTPDGRKAIISRPAKDEVAMFSAVCTHQGCTVKPEGEQLHCPCHNSLFDPYTGEVRGGPADEPLPRIDVEVRGNDIVTA